MFIHNATFIISAAASSSGAAASAGGISTTTMVVGGVVGAAAAGSSSGGESSSTYTAPSTTTTSSSTYSSYSVVLIGHDYPQGAYDILVSTYNGYNGFTVSYTNASTSCSSLGLTTNCTEANYGDTTGVDFIMAYNY